MSDAQPTAPEPSPAPSKIRYSPWFPREADEIEITLEVITVDGKTIIGKDQN